MPLTSPATRSMPTAAATSTAWPGRRSGPTEPRRAPFHDASVVARAPRARSARRALADVPSGQGVVALQQRQARHRAPAGARAARAEPVAAAGAAAARAVDRLQQRAAV